MFVSTDTPWLAADEQIAWRAYLRGVAVVFEALNKDILDSDNLSLHEYEVLSRLSESPERSMRMSTLADHLVHSRSRLTHTVRRLEERGFVSRTVCENDRRGVNCNLTETGWQALVKAAPSHVRSVREHLVDKLGHDQMIELGSLCAKLFDDDVAL